tara:strand:+ start:193 stop:570 length:378 start_codon:yes stop_codon:yes gene_type:complete
MANPRTPKAVARITGADRLHPGRHAGRTEPATAALGDMPDHMSKAEREAWAALYYDMPWLTRSDRGILKLAARLSVMAEQPDCSMGIYTQLRLCLSSMGGTPTDRSKVAASSDGAGDDPADAYFN